MTYYTDNQATQFAYGEIFNYEFEMEQLPGKDYFDQLDDSALFSEGIKNRIREMGYHDDLDMMRFLTNLCKEAGVPLSRQTITNWISGGTPASSDAGRDNVYKLSFALKLNAVQTGEFFLKCYLERPFNYKNLHEAVYFFCLNNGLKYIDAVRIIEQAEALPILDTPNAQEVTEEIGRALQTLNSKDALLAYLQENRNGFAVQNKTATERIAALIEKCYVLAAAEFDFQKKTCAKEA